MCVCLGYLGVGQGSGGPARCSGCRPYDAPGSRGWALRGVRDRECGCSNFLDNIQMSIHMCLLLCRAAIVQLYDVRFGLQYTFQCFAGRGHVRTHARTACCPIGECPHSRVMSCTSVHEVHCAPKHTSLSMSWMFRTTYSPDAHIGRELRHRSPRHRARSCNRLCCLRPAARCVTLSAICSVTR